ncbi:MAG: NAD(P)H-dependent oxidoreductase subunit E [Desulfopila sp.]
MTANVEKVDEIFEEIYRKSEATGGNIITILQNIQEEIGYISEEAVNWFARRTGIAAAKYYGVATFYAQFHLTPRGKNIITVCSGTVCHVKGAQRIITKLKENLRLKKDAQTTGDLQFTLENVNCVGACSIAPVVLVNNKVFGKQNPESMIKNLTPYKE